jgi:hypothetical protein
MKSCLELYLYIRSLKPGIRSSFLYIMSASEAEEDNATEEELVAQAAQIFGPGPARRGKRGGGTRGGRGGRGRGGGKGRYQPYAARHARPPEAAAAEDEDKEDAAARAEERKMNAALAGSNANAGDEQPEPLPMDEMEQKQQATLTELERKMYLDGSIDWEQVLEEDLKIANEKADEQGLPLDSPERESFLHYDPDTNKRCVSCQNQGRLANNDPFNDLNDFMSDNYTPATILYALTQVRDAYIKQFMPKKVEPVFAKNSIFFVQAEQQGQQQPVAWFWYRRVIYNHLISHRPLPLTQAENDLHQIDISCQMAMISQIRRDEFTGRKYWDGKIAASLAKLHELKSKKEAEVQKLRKSRRAYF